VAEERRNNEDKQRSRADEQTHSNERSSERGLEKIEALEILILLARRNRKRWRKDATTKKSRRASRQ
jgi:hypothetical protein